MSDSQPNVTAEPGELGCDGASRVTFSFQTAAELVRKPADLVLILDISGRLRNEMAQLKSAAKQLIRIVAESRGGSQIRFANNTRMALITCQDESKLELDLTDNAYTMSRVVDNLQAGGSTYHISAFTMARSVLSKNRGTNRKVIMFTASPTPDPAATAGAAQMLRDDGVEVFCIGLKVDPGQLSQWTSEPKEQHLSCTDDPSQLGNAFVEIAAEAALSGVHDGLLQVELTPDFQLETGSLRASPGTLRVSGTQRLDWQHDTAGLSAEPRTCTLRFGVQHIGTQGGQKPFAAAVNYRDREGHALTFAPPELLVNCPPPKPLPQLTSFEVPRCRDGVRVQLEAVTIPDPPATPGI